MIKIITQQGVSLDLDPTSSFSIEYKSPILENDAIPTPWSTPIAFPPTQTNCKVFQYVDALYLSPVITSVNANVIIDGIPFASGVLEYEDLSEGNLNYVFSAKNKFKRLEDIDISEAAHLAQVPTNINEFYDYCRRNARVKLPLMVNKKEALVGFVDKDSWREFSLRRWHNIPAAAISSVDASQYLTTPVVRVADFIYDAFPNASIDNEIRWNLEKLYLLCPYKPDYTNATNGFGQTIDIRKTLPKLSMQDLILNVLKIFGASVYNNGDEIVITSADSVLSSICQKDWTNNLSAVFSSNPELGQPLLLRFNDESNKSVYDPSNLELDSASGAITDASEYFDVLRLAVESSAVGNYVAVRHLETNDILSATAIIIAGDVVGNTLFTKTVVNSDNVYRHQAAVGSDVGEYFDSSIDLSVPAIIPEMFLWKESSGAKEVFTTAALIDPPAIGNERGNLAMIGVMSPDGQFSDKGCYVNRNGRDAQTGMSLDPGFLARKFQSKFQQWMESDRQIVSVDLNLSLADIIGFKMNEKIRFGCREWLPLSLSATIDAATGRVEASGEFISV